MKINFIEHNLSTFNQGFLEHSGSSQCMRDKSAGLCKENNRGYNVAFNGSLPIKSVAAVNAVKSKNMQVLDWLLNFAYKHNVAGSALMSLFLAGVLRPATIMLLPGKNDKEDKIYASGHSMASGLIGFAVSTIVTTPWDNGIKKIMDNYKNHYDTVIGNIKTGQNNEPVPLKYKFNILNKRYEKLVEIAKQEVTNVTKNEKRALKNQINVLELQMKNITDWVIAIPRSMLTIALIPPILKYVFGLEKKKSDNTKVDTTVQNPAKQIAAATYSGFAKVKSLDNFMGGQH